MMWNLEDIIGFSYHQQLMDDIEVLDGASDEMDMDRVQRGDLSPVFFGSALTNRRGDIPGAFP